MGLCLTRRYDESIVILDPIDGKTVITEIKVVGLRGSQVKLLIDTKDYKFPVHRKETYESLQAQGSNTGFIEKRKKN